MVSKTGIPVTLLTLAGTLPFMIFAWTSLAPWQPAGLLGIDGPEAIITVWQMGLVSLLMYGVAILSFMTGIRWGGGLAADRETPNTLTMSLSVLPSLWAVLAGAIGIYGLIIGDPLNGGVSAYMPAALIMLAGGFAVLLAFDVHAGYPMGYVRLRIIATIIAILALGIPAWKAL